MDPARQVFVQALGVVATAAWCALATWGLLALLQAMLGLRVAPETETEGLTSGNTTSAAIFCEVRPGQASGARGRPFPLPVSAYNPGLSAR